MGVRITAIHNARSGARDLNDEYVILLNESTETVPLAGYTVTSRAAERQRDRNYTLPDQVHVKGQGLSRWTCGPGALIFVRTGEGRDQYFPKSDGAPAQFHFYMGRREFIWVTAGDLVYLRHPNGQFVTEPFTVP
jgi:hypothetical protein